ncbi:MAG: acetyl-CoA C-acyltransferase [Promethearchaeota archaeon]
MIGREVYMVDYVRTPFSRSRPRMPHRDAFGEIWSPVLVAETLVNMMDVRMAEKVKRDEVDEFIYGNAFTVGTNFPFSGKMSLFMAGFPETTPSFATERQCGSAMTAMHMGTMEIAMGYSDIVIATGTEHMTLEPMMGNKHMSYPSGLFNPTSKWYNKGLDFIPMFQTAQKLFEQEYPTFTKEDMDKFGVRSHNLAEKALDDGFFKGEIVPIKAHIESKDKDEALGTEKIIDYDLSIRRGATLEAMRNLRPVSNPGFNGGYKEPWVFTKEEYVKNFGTDLGQITAGNSSPLNAGAATVMLMSGEKMKEKGLEPMARIVDIGRAAVDPSVMGRGPVPASRMALEQAGLKVEDIDYWEINEAFCIVAQNCIQKLGIENWDKIVNIHGNATAIGHPLAATGTRLPGTLARILKEKKARYGLANMCVGGGQGTAIILENPDA